MAFVGITNFTQPSYELGYAFKLCRMMLTVLIALFNLWGFIVGMIIIVLLISFNPTITGRCYLYPLIPFNAQKLSSLLIRKKINNNNN
jgi:stage V sporulation protein AF